MPGSGLSRMVTVLKGCDWLYVRRSLGLFVLIAALASLLTGCGGGGGGGGTTTNGNGTSVKGIVLRAEDNSAVSGATINVGGVQGTTGTDGSFLLQNVSSTVTSATLTPPAPALKRTLVLALTSKVVNDLGNIFTSNTGYTAVAVGTVVAPINGSLVGVGNATVTIAGTQVTTAATTGAFTVSNLPIGLGADANTPIGNITAPDFAPKPIYAPFVFAAGNNALGQQVLGAPVGTTAPGVPYTIQGNVTVGGKATSGIAVLLLNSALAQVGTTTTDINGNYSFWVVPGTYTVQATYGQGSGTNQTVLVTLAALDTPVTAPVIMF